MNTSDAPQPEPRAANPTRHEPWWQQPIEQRRAVFVCLGKLEREHRDAGRLELADAMEAAWSDLRLAAPEDAPPSVSEAPLLTFSTEGVEIRPRSQRGALLTHEEWASVKERALMDAVAVQGATRSAVLNLARSITREVDAVVRRVGGPDAPPDQLAELTPRDRETAAFHLDAVVKRYARVREIPRAQARNELTALLKELERWELAR